MGLKTPKKLDVLRISPQDIFFGNKLWWRRGESNPCPNIHQREHLRAQTVISGSRLPCSRRLRQAVTPEGQVSFILHGRLKALPAHVHHKTTPDSGQWSSRVRRPLLKQRQEQCCCCSLIYKLPILRMLGASARFFRLCIPVETGTPPYYHCQRACAGKTPWGSFRAQRHAGGKGAV